MASRSSQATFILYPKLLLSRDTLSFLNFPSQWLVGIKVAVTALIPTNH